MKKSEISDSNQTEEYSFEEKIWNGSGILFRSVRPLFLYLFLPPLLMLVGMHLFGGRTTEEVISGSGNFYYTLGIFLTIYLLYRRSVKQNSSLKEEATLDWSELDYKKIGCLVGMGFGFGFFFSALITVVPFPKVLMESYSGASEALRSGTDQWLALFSTVLLAPVTEEIIFRGYMLNRLLGWFREKTAIWIVSVAFALCHVSPLWIAYALAMGLLLAKVSIVEDNISYSIALHIGFNMNVLPIWLINHHETLQSILFANNGLIALYGAAALAAGIYFGRKYARGME